MRNYLIVKGQPGCKHHSDNHRGAQHSASCSRTVASSCDQATRHKEPQTPPRISEPQGFRQEKQLPLL